MKRILLTGAGSSSFIGRNLKELLASDYAIFAPSHAELELLDYAALEQYCAANQIDIIIHAAVHVPMFNGAANEFFNDMQMFLNIDKISHRVEKVLYFGSGAEYDKRRDLRMIREEEIGSSIPVTEYGLAKYTMNQIARASENIYNLRLFGVFGKYELWQIKFLSNLCCKAIYQMPLTVRSDCYFDFLYIDELARITKWFIEQNPRYHDYNVCAGQDYLLTQLAEKVRAVRKQDLPIVLLSQERNRDYSASNARLLAEFDGAPLMQMDNALEKLYDYYLSIQEEIDLNVLRESR
jgi:UDP-glucose 4-epimerase